MKKQKQDFSVLKKADSRTVEQISEICPVLNQNEQKRIFARSQAKYRHYQKAAEPYADEEIFQAEPVKTSGIFMNFGAAAACLLVCAGTVGGGIYLTRHQKDFSASQSAEQLASETEPETETSASETTMSETIQTTAKLKEILTTAETFSTTAESVTETQTETTVPETSGTTAESAQTTIVQTSAAEPEPTETQTPETYPKQPEISQIQTTAGTRIQTTVTTVQEIPAVITEPESSETIPETTEEPPIETTPEPVTEPPTEPLPENITVENVQYIRNDQLYYSKFDDFYLNHNGLAYDVITSREELEEQVSEILPPSAKELSSFDYENFYQKLEKYDTAFFENYDLIFIRKYEPSGSLWNEYDSFSVDEENNCDIKINHHLPYEATCDIAIWAICIETNKSIENVNSLNIRFEDKWVETFYD